MMQYRYKAYFFLVVSIFTYACITQGCGQSAHQFVKNSLHQNVPDESIAKGQALAKQYCQSCHMFPSPSLLDAKTWENGVLPQMGPRLGIFEYQYRRYPNSVNDVHVGRGYYPLKPLVTPAEWQSIIDYYTSVSPDSLQQPPALIPADGSSLFQALTPQASYPNPATCLIRADPFTKTIITSDILKRECYRYSASLQLVDSFLQNSIITSMLFTKHTITACNIGVFSPNNARAGSVESIVRNDENHPRILADTLLRPASIAAADLNNDGKTDYITCGFGYIKGALSWWENVDGDNYREHIIKGVPGAIKAYTGDYNHDGLQDIWVLFAQGDESISLFTNLGNGKFEEKKVLQFPPCYGSSSFSLEDFNKDGFPDILYTCGDNADYSTIFKPYHGVYIFINDGHNNFKQQFFYHINGCYNAIAFDVDKDGKTDIAAIAYFADYQKKPREGFVLLKNADAFGYKPYYLDETMAGRWITMDTVDVNGDGKTDILLANCSVGPTINKSAYNWKKGPPFMLLKNTTK